MQNETPAGDEAVPLSSDPTAANQQLIRVSCGLCNTLMYATQEQVGQTIVCPDCGVPTLVKRPPDERSQKPLSSAGDVGEYSLARWPRPAAAVPPDETQAAATVECPLCHTRVSVSPTQIGKRIPCPDCGREMVILPPPPPPKARLPPKPQEEYNLTARHDAGAAAVASANAPSGVSDVEDHALARARQKLKFDVGRPTLPRWPFLTGTISFPFCSRAAAFAFVLAAWSLLPMGLVREYGPASASGDPRLMFLAAMYMAVAVITALMWFVFAAGCAPGCAARHGSRLRQDRELA